MKSFADIDIENKGDYLKLLGSICKLSRLFSESSIPYINYRIAENIFCKSFNAGNLSRSDTAFDAKYQNVGIGLKTFTCPSNASTEKVAEFNSLSQELNGYSGKELALKLSEFRNKRIESASKVYKINSSIYHIVARKDNELVLFETDYRKIDIDGIKKVKQNNASLEFEDGNNLYRYNYSKSTLFRKFIIPGNAYYLPIDIIKDPFEFLMSLTTKEDLYDPSKKVLVQGVDYVILPLYKSSSPDREVQEKSALNQWNSKPRPGQISRDPGEMYIPVPAVVHKKYPDFFPPVEFEKEYFNLKTPTGDVFKASMCQTHKMNIKGKEINKGKGLMTNPNKDLAKWLLREALLLEERELLTTAKLDEIGVDSVIVQKIDDDNFYIDIMKSFSFEKFINY